LSADSIVYSFGIGRDVSFDLSLIDTFGMTVHGFDPTPRSRQWVTHQDLPSRFVFHDVGVADSDGVARFFPPESPEHSSYSLCNNPAGDEGLEAPVRRLTTIAAELGHTHIDLLKMDIEGAEYEVLEDLGRTGFPVHQLLVEFHGRYFPEGDRKTDEAIRLLRAAGFRLFHVASNKLDHSFLGPTGPVSFAQEEDSVK